MSDKEVTSLGMGLGFLASAERCEALGAGGGAVGRVSCFCSLRTGSSLEKQSLTVKLEEPLILRAFELSTLFKALVF